MFEGNYAAPWIFVVDTDSYAGNFEREMCAYATGLIGNCGVGEENATLFLEETDTEEYDNPLEEIRENVQDEHGTHRPCSIWSTPGRLNNGMGSHYNDGDSIPPVNLEQHGFTDEADFKKRTGCEPGTGRFPAYESVAIFFNERPTDEQIEMMKARCEKFVETQTDFFDKPYCKIIGFRLIEQEQIINETEHQI